MIKEKDVPQLQRIIEQSYGETSRVASKLYGKAHDEKGDGLLKRLALKAKANSLINGDRNFIKVGKLKKSAG